MICRRASDAGTGCAVRSVPVEMFQEPDGVVSGGKDPGLGLGGVLAQADRSTVAQPPVLVDQPVQQVGEMPAISSSAARTASVISSRRVGIAHRGQDVGGVGALRGALAHQSGLLEAGQREVEKTVGTVVLGKAVAEVGQHAVVEA